MKPSQLSAIVLMLLSGAPGLIRAETVREVADGGNVTVGCQFLFAGHTKVFCKDDCQHEDNILVETENAKCNGRYCIEFKYTLLGYNVMYVNITNVTSADSGRYQCVLKRSLMKNGIQEFSINVTKDAALNPSYTLKPQGSPNVSPTSVTDLAGQTGSTALYAGLVLAAVAVLLTVALLIFYCNNRRSKPKEHPVSAEYEPMTEHNRLYEEIQVVTNSGSRAVEISTVYASASFSKSIDDQTSSDIYSLATVPTVQLS